MRAGTDSQSRDGLTVLRALFFYLLLAGPLIALCTYIVVDGFAPDAGWVLPLAVGLAISSVVLAQAVMRNPIDARDEMTFANWYRKKFFLAFALADAPYLIAFLLAMFHDAFLPVLIVLPGYLVAMMSIGPFGRTFASLQSRVNAAGSTVDVVQALRAAPSRPTES